MRIFTLILQTWPDYSCTYLYIYIYTSLRHMKINVLFNGAYRLGNYGTNYRHQIAQAYSVRLGECHLLRFSTPLGS